MEQDVLVKNGKIDDLHNVFCTLDGTAKGHTFNYNGHIDVVRLGEFSLRPVGTREAPIVEDKIVGGDCCDMKGSVAAMIIASDLVMKAGIRLKGRHVFRIVSREEGRKQECTGYMMEERGVEAEIGLIGEVSIRSLMSVKFGYRGWNKIQHEKAGR